MLPNALVIALIKVFMESLLNRNVHPLLIIKPATYFYFTLLGRLYALHFICIIPWTFLISFSPALIILLSTVCDCRLQMILWVWWVGRKDVSLRPTHWTSVCVRVCARTDKQGNPLNWHPVPRVPVCPPFCCSRANDVWKMGRRTSTLLHIGTRMIGATAPLLLCCLRFLTTANEVRGSEPTPQSDSLVQDSWISCFVARVPSSAKKEGLPTTCRSCRRRRRQRETLQVAVLTLPSLLLIPGDLLLIRRLD